MTASISSETLANYKLSLRLMRNKKRGLKLAISRGLESDKWIGYVYQLELLNAIEGDMRKAIVSNTGSQRYSFQNRK